MVSFGGDFQRQIIDVTREDNAQIEFNNNAAIEKHKELVQSLQGTDKTNEEIAGGITSMGEIQKVKKFSDMYKSVSSGEKSIGDLMREEGSIGDLVGKGGGRVMNGMSRLTQQVAQLRSGVGAGAGVGSSLADGSEPIQMENFGSLDESGSEAQAVTEVSGADRGAGAAASAESATADATNAASAGERAGVAEGAASDVVGGAEDLARGGAGIAEKVGASAGEIAAEGLAKTAGKVALGFGGKVLGNVGGAIDVVKDFEEVSKTGHITDFFKGSGGSVTDQIGDGLQVVGGLLDLSGIGAPLGALMSGVGGVVQEIGNANDNKQKEQTTSAEAPPTQTLMASANLGALGGLASAQVNPMKLITGSGTF